MSQPKALGSREFYALIGDGAAPEVFTFLCVASGVDSEESVDTEDAYLPDCADPSKLPSRVSAIKSRTWDMKLSGVTDPANAGYIRLRALFRDGVSGNFQLKKDRPGAQGGSTRTGSFLVKKLSETKADNGLVKFSCDLAGQGDYTEEANP